MDPTETSSNSAFLAPNSDILGRTETSPEGCGILTLLRFAHDLRLGFILDKNQGKSAIRAAFNVGNFEASDFVRMIDPKKN